METITLKVRGMTCGGCVASVERVLRALDGVAQVDVSLDEGGKATVQFEAGRASPADFETAIGDAGYEVER